MRYLPVALQIFALLLTNESFAYQDRNDDPLEPVNRVVYNFNDAMDTMIIHPAAEAYGFVIPKYLQDRVGAELTFLAEPGNLINHLFVWDQENFSLTFGRILTNGILGLGGLFDVASVVGMDPKPNDFGLTLKHYGAGTGPYLYIPFIGPSSVRDSIGIPVNYIFDPYNFKATDNMKFIRYGLTTLDKRYKASDDLSSLGSISLDGYATQRSIYLQKRGELNFYEDY